MTRKMFNSQYGLAICLLHLCFFLLFHSSPQANELVNLTLHDEVYTFIKRLTAKNLIKKRLDNTQPLKRREVAEALIEITEKRQSGQIRLTSVERTHLESYQWLFADEIDVLKPGFLSQTENPHAVTFKDENYKIDLDFKLKDEVAFTKLSSEDSQNTGITSASFIMRAKLGHNLGFSSTWDNRLLLGSATYNPYQGELSDSFSGLLESDSRTMTSTEAYAILDLSWLAIQWGIENMWWGPGWRGSLMLSDNSPPTDTLRLSGLYGPLRYTYLTSILRVRVKATEEYYPKYMSAHRLEFLPYKGISIGISETMVFVERYDLRYLHPIIPFVTSQVGGYKSNEMLGCDLDVTLLPSIEFYAELMVDDFQTDEGLEAFRLWNSKYGALVGGYWVDPFGLKDTDARIEYAFVNQYAYTNTYEGYLTDYTNRGFVIGHWMGTDADDLWFDVKHWLTGNLRFSLTYERERQGEGDVTKRFPYTGGPTPKIDWEFLSGTAESTHSFSAGLAYVSIGKWAADIGYTYSRIRNVAHEPGVDGKRHQLLLKAEYRF